MTESKKKRKPYNMYERDAAYIGGDRKRKQEERQHRSELTEGNATKRK